MSSRNNCVLLLASLMTVAFAITPELCPKSDGDLKVFKNYCFYFHVNNNATLEEAESVCQNIGGHLVMVKTQDISNFIDKELKQTLNVTKHIWIGLTRFQNADDPTAVSYHWGDDKHTGKIDETLLKSIKRYGDIIERLGTEGDDVVQNKSVGKPFVCQYEVKDGSTPKPNLPSGNTTTSGEIIANTTVENPQTGTGNRTNITASMIDEIRPSPVHVHLSHPPMSSHNNVPIVVTKTVHVTVTETVVVKTTEVVTVTQKPQTSGMIRPESTMSSSFPSTLFHESEASSGLSAMTSETETIAIMSTEPTQASTTLPLESMASFEVQSSNKFLSVTQPSNVPPIGSLQSDSMTVDNQQISSSFPSKNKMTPILTQDTLSPIESTDIITKEFSDRMSISIESLVQPTTLTTYSGNISDKALKPTVPFVSDMWQSNTNENILKTDMISPTVLQSETNYGSNNATKPQTIVPSFTLSNTPAIKTSSSQLTIATNILKMSQSLESGINYESESKVFTGSSPIIFPSQFSQVEMFSSQTPAATNAYTHLLLKSHSTSRTPTPNWPTTLLPTAPTTTKPPCPSIGSNPARMRLFDYKCFYFEVVQRVRFDEANRFCQKHGGSLAFIKGSDTQTFILKQLQSLLGLGEVSLSWIGIKKNSTGDGKYYWQDGDLVQYNNFNPSDPELNIVAILSVSGAWMRLANTFPANFICEFDSYISKPTAIPDTTSSAQSLATQEENSSIDYMSDYILSEIIEDEFSTEIFQDIDASSDVIDEEFMTSDISFTPSLDASFTNDLSSYDEEATSLPEISDSIKPIFSEFSWGDSSTVISPSSVSSQDMTSTSHITTTTTTTTTTPKTTTEFPYKSQCFQHGNKCFYFNIEDRVSWHDANKFCQQHGGSLAFIKDKDTQLFIEQTMHDRLLIKHTVLLWIGLQKNETNHNDLYYWMDGDLAIYTNFLSNTPLQEYITMLSSSGKWADISGYYTAYFICQFDSLIIDTKPTSTMIVQSSSVQDISDISMPSAIITPSTPYSSEAISDMSKPPATITPRTPYSSEAISDMSKPPATITPRTPYSSEAISDMSKPPATITPRTPYSSEAINTTIKIKPTALPFNKPCYQFGDKCYFFETTKRSSFYDASKFCTQHGGSLILIKNKKILSFAVQTIREMLTSGEFSIMWIGLRQDVTKNDTQYYWMDGEVATYTNFVKPQPVYPYISMFSSNGKWLDLKGHFRNFYICEFDSSQVTSMITQETTTISTTQFTKAKTDTTINIAYPATTPTPYLKPCYKFMDSCFHFELERRESFQGANDFCQRYGGTLAQVRSEDTQFFIEETLLDKLHPETFHLIWVGLQREKDGMYYWLDGKKAIYENFQNPSPSNEAAVIKSTNGRWLDISKRWPCNFICEFQVGQNTPTTTSVSNIRQPSTLPPNTPLFNKDFCPFKYKDKDFKKQSDADKYVHVFQNYKCLYFKLDTRVTFQEARDKCEEYGGSLVMIKSQDLQDFIELKFKETPKLEYYYRIWIGLQIDPAKQDGKYYWLDGTPLNYNHFKFAPSKSTGDNAVLVLKGGDWLETTAQNNKNAFICQYILSQP